MGKRREREERERGEREREREREEITALWASPQTNKQTNKSREREITAHLVELQKGTTTNKQTNPGMRTRQDVDERERERERERGGGGELGTYFLKCSLAVLSSSAC